MSGDLEWRIRAVAGPRRVVDRNDLLALGVTPSGVRHRLRSGRLTELHRGVYGLGPPPFPVDSLWLAALKATGPPVALGLLTAAAADGFAPARPGPVQVVVPPDRRVVRPGIEVHRLHLPPGATTTRDGLAVTRPAVTLVHLAATATPAALERLVQEAFAQRKVTREALLACLAAHRRARGGRVLREMLDADVQAARSAPERVMLDLIRGTDLPRPVVNLREGRWTPDLVWPELGLVLEIDGYASHSSPWAFDRDRRKDRAQANADREVLRASGREIARRPLAVLADVARGVERRETVRRSRSV